MILKCILKISRKVNVLLEFEFMICCCRLVVIMFIYSVILLVIKIVRRKYMMF